MRPAGLVLLSLFLLGLVTGAGQQQTQTRPAEKMDPIAKEKAKLMKDGQATLTEATAIAEKHAKGQALAVRCDLQPAETDPKAGDKGNRPGGPVDDVTRADVKIRLIYSVQVFADDRIQEIKVDGLERKVVSAN
jgi:hypothetical protein